MPLHLRYTALAITSASLGSLVRGIGARPRLACRVGCERTSLCLLRGWDNVMVVGPRG
jgi:hypothetical protein